VDSSGPELGLLAGCCEHGDEHSYLKKGEEFLE
jgi:hypothetical protein